MKAAYVALPALLAMVLATLGTGAGAATSARDFDPVFSPDGRTLAFVRSTGPSESIMLVGSDGRNLRTLVRGASASFLTWSPDARSLAYSADRSIWRVDLADPTPRQLTSPAAEDEDWQPAWSPDGRWIAFDRFERCFRCTGIYVMAPDGSQLREIAQDGRRPAWSPDSNEIAISLANDLLDIDISGTVLVRRNANYAAWSPRGIYLAYTNAGLYVIRRATGVSRRLTPYVGSHPAWAPDGRVIAAGSRGNVVLVRAKDGRILTRFRTSNPEGGTPTWSPGAVVAFVHSGDCGIDVAREDGTHVRRLTRTC